MALSQKNSGWMVKFSYGRLLPVRKISFFKNKNKALKDFTDLTSFKQLLLVSRMGEFFEVIGEGLDLL